MFLNHFNQPATAKINKINKLLESEFNVSVKTGFPSKAKLKRLNETATQQLITLRNSNKKFHLDPDYAKFLGIKDVTETMLGEGMYAESPKYREMKEMICASVQELMDSGYTEEEACSECMNRYRMDSRFVYDDEHVMPIVINAAKQYMERCNSGTIAEPSSKLLAELSRTCGVKMTTEGMNTIEQRLAEFATAANKSRDAVVSFLNGLEPKAMREGIRMFERKVSESNAFIKARQDAIAAGGKQFTVGDRTYPVTGDSQLNEVNTEERERLFDEFINTANHQLYRAEDFAGSMWLTNFPRDGFEVAFDLCTMGDCDEAADYLMQAYYLGLNDDREKDSQSMAALDEIKSELEADLRTLNLERLQDEELDESSGAFDDIVSEIINEEVDVEQAEVVMAVRAMSSDIQDHVEKIGRMINETVPAIADQMRAEMGATQTQSFVDAAAELLETYLDAAKMAKSNLDAQVAQLSGEPQVDAFGTGNVPADMDTDIDDEPVDNIPASAGPEDAPLGRDKV